MKGYTKDRVTFHEEGYYGPGYPAVNVKVYGRTVTIDEVVERFGCSEKTAEQALEYWWEFACQRFWEEVPEMAEYRLGTGLKVYSAGRSDGWAVVHNLPPIESWDAVLLHKWALFERDCHREIEYLCSRDYVFDEISANRWAEEGAEAYNFYEDSNRQDHCIVDLKRIARDAVEEQTGVNGTVVVP